GRNNAIGRCDHQSVVKRREPLRVTIEIDAPDREDQTEPEQRLPDQAEKQRSDEECKDERIALPMNRNERLLDRIGQAHVFSLVEWRNGFPTEMVATPQLVKACSGVCHPSAFLFIGWRL